MRDVISNETIKEINEVIDEILTNIDNNVRNIQIGEGAGTLPTLLSYTNYDGRTYEIHGSTFTHHIIIDDANGRTTGHIEDGDILTTVGDKNGRQIGTVDEKISGHSNYEYFRESLYSVATDSYGYEFDKRIPFDIARNYDSGITGFSFDIRERYNEHSISNESCTVMTYKLTNIPVGATFTVTFRGQFHGDFLADKDSYIVINDRYDETGSTSPDPIGYAVVEIIKDDQTHNYSITCTNSTQFTDLYLHFYFKVDSFVAFDVDSFLVSDMDLGVIRSSFYHDGESYSFLQGGGGGTSDLDAIELTYAEYQALTPAEKTDPDKIYFITDYPSGSGVVINPTGTATDTAETIEVDGTIYDFMDADAVHTADIGVAGGVAELDANGKVPSSQLPSYVDDVVEYASISAFPATGESGKIYIALDTNKTYRWTGSVYVEISPSLALGETSSTAYRGDRGKTAYDHSQSDHSGIAPAFTEASTRANIASGETFATLLGKIKKFFSDLKAVAFTGAYSDLSGTPTIPTVNNGTLTIKRNNTSVGTFTANQSSASNINIECATPSDVEGSKTVTGNPITITDGSEIYAEELSVDLEPIQSGSGTPSPSNVRPIQGYDIVSVDRCGKNLLNPNALGVVRGKTILTDGTLTDASYVSVSDYIPVKNNATLTLKTSAISIGGYNRRIVCFDNNKQCLGTCVGTSGNPLGEEIITGTVIANTAFVRVPFLTTGSTNQLEEGSTATTYEPYNGQTVSLQLGNKNLLPMTVEGIKSINTSGTWSGNIYTLANVSFTVLTNENGCVTGIKANASTAASGNVDIFIPVPTLTDGANYILNGGCAGGSNNTYKLQVCYGQDNSDAATSYTGEDVSFTKLANYSYICRIRVYSGQTISNKIFYPMLRSASVSDPTFSPYDPTLGGMVYGGQLTLNDDGSAVFVGDRVYREFTANDNNTWNLLSGYSNTFYCAWTKDSIAPTATGTDGVCSSYNVVRKVIANLANGEITLNHTSISSAYSSACVKDTQYSTAANFKASLTTPLQIVYPLATPLTLHLSAEQLKLLQGTNNVWSNAGDVTLKYQPDNVIAEPKADVQRLRDDVDDRLVDNASKNIFDPTKLAGKYDSGFTSNYDATTHKLTLTGKWYGYWICRVNPNTDYAFSAKLISATVTANCNIYKSDGTVVVSDLLVGGSFNNQSDFTFNSGDTNYVAILLYSGNNSSGTTVLQNIQLEIGSSPTAYEEYYPSNVELYNKTAELQKGINKCFDIPTYATAYVDLKPYTAQNMYKCPADGIVVISINQGETGFLGFAIYPGVVIKEVYGSTDHVVRDYAIVKKGMSLYHRGSASGTLHYYYNNY